MPLMADISVQRQDWREWSRLAPTWERIHNLCPEASFFLSREWVDCWLATFGESLNPELLTFVGDGEVVGCCVLVWRTQWIRGIPLRRVYLNCAGEDDADSTYIEYNRLLSLPDCAGPAAEALVSFLKGLQWDELLLPGMIESSAVCAAAGSLGRVEVSDLPTFHVDLRRLRGDGADYDSVLPAKARKNIRRSHRAYDAIHGPCRLLIAGSAEEAVAMLRRLAELHQSSWRDGGQRGAFASPRFCGFHETLIRQCFSGGRILLFQAVTGSEAIGSLYCLVDRGWVRYYQSGFNYSLDPKSSPGLLTLYLAIRHCLERPELLAFDMMAGDAQYKRSLATTEERLRWLVVRRATVRTWLFCTLRWVKRAVSGALKRARRNPEDASPPDSRA
jgi:hypothetical protein